jgi:hypothetical protein
MEAPTTYQELLAEVYEENAKSNLVYQQEFEDEDAHPYQDEDYSENELEDKEEFNKPQGARGKPEHVIKPKPKDDPAGKTSYNIDKHIRTYALNIDGRFRGNIVLPIAPSTCGGLSLSVLGSESAFFAFPPSRSYKNLFSIRVTSFEFFNSFYTYSAINPTTGIGRGNTTFTITDFGTPASPLLSPVSYLIQVPDGNYSILDPVEYPSVTNNLLLIIQTLVRNVDPLAFGSSAGNFTAGINPVSGLVYFECSSAPSRVFSITFPTTTDNSTQNGIGYNLGFYGNSYTATNPSVDPTFFPVGLGDKQITADTFFDTIQDTYVYLRINDYDIIKHQNNDQTEFGAFMKIPLMVPKGGIQYMSSTTNTTAREYYFPQPSNISSFVFQMVDAFGKTLQMNGSTFSVTMELQEVLQTDIYEKMLEL